MFISFVLKALIFSNLFAQDTSIEGNWKTIDDSTTKPRAIVEIYKVGEMYSAKIKAILPPGDPAKLCTKCTAEKFNRPVVGLEILSNLKEVKKNQEWSEGQILDPENGKTYKCTIKLINPQALEIRGYIGISLFGRSQTWLRAN